MATVGFEKAYIGILNADGKVATDNIHEMNAAEGGTISAGISGMGAPMNTVYASNIPFHVSAVGTGTVELELAIANLPLSVRAKLMGEEVDPETGIIKGGPKNRPPYAAVILKSHDPDGNEVYYALTKGKFSQDGKDLATQEEGGVELSTDTISGTFIARSTDELTYAIGNTSVDGFTWEALRALIFPPVVTTP